MDEQSVNLIARKLSLVLIDAGIKMGKSAFHLDPQITIYEDFLAFIRSKGLQVSPLDGKYRLISISQWKQIIEYDWTNLKKWVAYYYDCDDFSRVFAGHIYEMFEVNSVGTVYGKVYVAADNTFIDHHYWNVIISQEPDGKHLWFFEPNSKDKTMALVEYNGGKIKIGSWIYEPIKISSI